MLECDQLRGGQYAEQRTSCKRNGEETEEGDENEEIGRRLSHYGDAVQQVRCSRAGSNLAVSVSVSVGLDLDEIIETEVVAGLGVRRRLLPSASRR